MRTERIELGWNPYERTKGGAVPFSNRVKEYKDFSKLHIRHAADGRDLKRQRYELDALHITLTGALATVPSLKNQKLKNNVIGSRTRAWVVAATEMFHEAMHGKRKRFREGEKLVMFMTCITKKHRYDASNWAETVKDWLEPPTKQVSGKDRGWGIGVIDDDYYVTSIADHAENVTAYRNCTRIHIVRRDLINEKFFAIYGEFLEMWEKASETFNDE